jgi:hypothetical protein
MEDVRLEMLKMWKASWENYVKNLSMMQEQGEKMLEMLFAQSDSAHDETKKVVKQAIENAKDAQDSYFQAVEENLKKVEEALAK